MAGDCYSLLDSPFGDMAIVANERGHIITVCLPKSWRYKKAISGDYQPMSPFFAKIKQQMAAYFSGTRVIWDLDIEIIGTQFQKQVWQALSSATYGNKLTYGQIAKAIGLENAQRAVGTAIGCNPIAIIIPCHRIVSVAKNGGGYDGGIEAKKWLLQHEQQH